MVSWTYPRVEVSTELKIQGVNLSEATKIRLQLKGHHR